MPRSILAPIKYSTFTADVNTDHTFYPTQWGWEWGNSSEPAAVGGSGFQFLPLKKSGVDWNRYENHPISQLKNYAYLDENMPYPIQPISHYAAAYKFTIHTFYLAVAQDRHKPPGESGHVSLFTRSNACAALKYPEGPSCHKKLILGHPAPCIPHYYSFPKRIK